MGTILVPGALLIGSALTGMSGIVFGWAKPVPINFRNLRNPKTDMIWVAAAGPGANLIQAILWAIVLKFLISMGIYEDFFIKMCVAGVSCNIVLMALNLIPIPPLDGGRIVTGLLPPGMAWQYSRIEPYGNVDSVCTDSDRNIVYFHAPLYENGAGHRSVVHLV